MLNVDFNLYLSVYENWASKEYRMKLTFKMGVSSSAGLTPDNSVSLPMSSQELNHKQQQHFVQDPSATDYREPSPNVKCWAL